jgi:hypothetical protein
LNGIAMAIERRTLQRIAVGHSVIGTLGTGQRFTPKKRTVPVIRFESGIDHIVYQLYGLMEDEPEVAVPKGR